MARKQRSKGTGSLFRKTARGPWIASYWDHSGKRREHSTRTTDRQAAERILTKLVADTALRRDLVIDPRDDRFATEGRRPLTEHVAAYLAHCRHVGHAPKHIEEKERHLAALLTGTGATRLAELSPDALERHQARMKDRGLSARSINFARQIAVAFYGWCVKTGRGDGDHRRGPDRPPAILPAVGARNGAKSRGIARRSNGRSRSGGKRKTPAFAGVFVRFVE